MKRTKSGSYQSDDAIAFGRQLLDENRQYGVVFIELDGTVRGISHGATHITGFSADDLLGQRSAVLYTPEDRERKLDEHELHTALVAGAAQDERWHMRKDGSNFWSSGVCVPLLDRAGKPNGFMKMFRDATHLRSRMKLLENTVQEKTIQLEQRETFLGTIAHELRNPLAPVKVASRIIEQALPADGRLDQAIKIIDRQMAALERLVEDLVDLTRTKTGKLNIVRAPANLQTVVGNAVDACRAAAATKDIALHVTMPSVQIEVELDAGRMHQVIVNLLNNAIKFTPRRGDVWVNATTDQTHALIFITDNGIGISAELLPKIFDMFTQAPDAGSQRGAGLGIGLALVKQVVELHQGTVEVTSEGPGKGSRFTVRIPQRRPQGSETEPMGR
ncbi:MAG: PAS domain-containing sensor histidine kinase [Gammaproteobacteria bacterium]